MAEGGTWRLCRGKRGDAVPDPALEKSMSSAQVEESSYKGWTLPSLCLYLGIQTLQRERVVGRDPGLV